MTRYTFPGDLFLYEGANNTVQLGVSAAFRVWSARVGGSDLTASMTDEDGVTPLSQDGSGNLVADGNGVRETMMGPDGVQTIYIDAGGGDRYPVYGIEAVVSALAGGGGGSGGSFVEDPLDPGFYIPAAGSGGGTTDPEIVRDTVASALVAGANTTITVNDAGDTITIAATGGTTGGGFAEDPTDPGTFVSDVGSDNPEFIRDTMASALVAGANVTITVNDAGDTLTIASTGGGGSGVANAPTYIVAASDSTQSDKDAATADGFLAGSTNAHVQIQAALDAAFTHASGGGTVKLCPGTYNTSALISMGHPTDGTGTYRVALVFERGAKVIWSGVTGTTPVIKIESSDCTIVNPWVQGSGNKGNGTGICLGGDVTNYGGRWTKTVYRCNIVTPALISNCNYGIETAIDKTVGPPPGTSSSGDNNIIGGFITNCKEGWRNAGFVNRIWGTTIAGCDINIHGTGDRNSQKMGVFGVTSNNYATASLWLEKDHGSTIVDLWSEHTAVQSGVPIQAILLGNTTNSTYTAHNTKFVGTTFLTLQDEQYAVRAIRANNVVFDNLVMSTNGNMPTSAIFRQDANFAGTPPPVVRCKRLSWMTGTVPATWDYATKSISKDSSSTGKVIIEAVSAPAGTTLANTTYGDLTPVPVDATYYVDKSGSPNTAVYWAKDRTGHIAAFAPDTATTSGLKAVLGALTASDVHFRFGPGRYHFLDAPVGNESWAGVEDHATFGTTSPPTKGLSFSGAGMYSTIISNRTNWPSGTDTEPLSFTNCQYVTVRDLTVESCGTYKSTTDALDFDQGAHIRIERVRVTHSRARGIIIDGGDLGKWGGHNVIRDCLLQGRPDRPGLGLVSGGSLAASTAYRYVVSWTDADLAGAQTAGETKPSDEALITTDATNKSVRVDLAIGPYTVTERKVYRALVGSSSWVRVATISNNTTTTYTDTGGAGTGVTMPVSHRSTIYDSAIEMLGTSYSKIVNNTIHGTGDFTTGLNPHGINISRKSTVPTVAAYNKVIGNTVRQVAGNGIRLLGGADNMVKDNDVSNSGTVAARAGCIRVEGATGISTLRNEIKDNRCFDDQDANSWSAGQTVNNQIVISATGTPTDTIINGNVLTAGASGSSATILDSGTNSLIWDNYGWNTEYSLFEKGADETGNFTFTQSMSGQVKWITGAATITMPGGMKPGTWATFVRDTASAITLAASGGATFKIPAGNSAAPRLQNSEITVKYRTSTEIHVSGDMG
jgi:parallel beta-helix repeat protein